MPTLHDPVALAIGPVEIRWYALFIVTGIMLGVALGRYLADRRGLDGDLVLDMAPIVVLAAIMGARLYYVMLEWDHFRHDLPAALNVRTGGLTIHGALVGGALSVWLFIRRAKGSPWTWFDVLAAPMALGQAIGRWGNWANQEAFGTPTNLPWAVTIDPGRRPAQYADQATFHPTFLYESLFNLAFAAGLAWLVLHGRRFTWYRDGMAIGFYLIGYGIVRLLLESIRTDSLYIGPLKAAYWLSLALILVGSVIVTSRHRSSRMMNASGDSD